MCAAEFGSCGGGWDGTGGASGMYGSGFSGGYFDSGRFGPGSAAEAAYAGRLQNTLDGLAAQRALDRGDYDRLAAILNGNENVGLSVDGEELWGALGGLLASAIGGEFGNAFQYRGGRRPPPRRGGGAIPNGRFTRRPPPRPRRSSVVFELEIRSFGKVVYRGTIDLRPTIQRIVEGRTLSQYRHDGSLFFNREGLLPQPFTGYYREYVVPTPGVNGPGPQRLVIGLGGEIYYTPNHYGSFRYVGRTPGNVSPP